MPDTPEPNRPEDGVPDQDEVKRRFREALDRKNARARQGESHADGSSKIHDSHGPAGGRRTFRRKSG